MVERGALNVSVPTFDQVHGEFRPRILRYLERMAGPEEAEDLAQEVFLRVARSLGSFRGDSRLSTWIYRIATNVALDRLRSRQARGAGEASEEALEEIRDDLRDLDPWGGEPRPAADQGVIRGEMAACVRGVVDGLAPDYRTVIVLKDVEGLTNPEIAEVLGVSLDAAKIRLHRARAKLREALEAACTFHRDERDVFSCDRKPGEGRDRE